MSALGRKRSFGSLSEARAISEAGESASTGVLAFRACAAGWWGRAGHERLRGRRSVALSAVVDVVGMGGDVPVGGLLRTDEVTQGVPC